MPAGSTCHSLTSRLLSPDNIARPGLSAGRTDRSRREQTKIVYPERARCVPTGPALRSVAATRWVAKAEEKRRRASQGRAPRGLAQPFPGYSTRSSAHTAFPGQSGTCSQPIVGRPVQSFTPWTA